MDADGMGGEVRFIGTVWVSKAILLKEEVRSKEPGEVRSNVIVSDPSVMMGKPVVSGTRVTVESILEKLAAGESKEQILAEYPRLSEESILAALGFASKALRADVVYPISTEAG